MSDVGRVLTIRFPDGTVVELKGGAEAAALDTQPVVELAEKKQSSIREWFRIAGEMLGSFLKNTMS